MLCNEPIINVYAGRIESLIESNEFNAFLDCYHNNSIYLHLTKGYRIVLETEHYYISMEFDGVKLEEKRCSVEKYKRSGEWLDSFRHEMDASDVWVEYEYTLFVGEHLIDVKTDGEKHIAFFDDFSVNIIPHRSADEISGNSHTNYLHVYGCERLITRRCTCGGTGELLLDFVSDYLVRCDKCHISTWANCNAIDAIEVWNEGETEVDASNIIVD